jgi:transposase
MKVKFPEDVRIFIACGQTDMRKSIHGLAAIVSQTFKLDPFQNALYLFCGRRRDRVKALYWEGDGFLLLSRGLKTEVFSGLEAMMRPGKSHLSSTAGYLKACLSIRRKSSKTSEVKKCYESLKPL